MAEFVGAIVGLVAVGGTVGHKVYQAVEAFKDAPDEFLALSNEITDFRLILNIVERALQNNQIPPVVLADIDLVALVLRSNATLNEIAALLAKVRRVESPGPDVRRRKWVTTAAKAKSLQKRLKSHKLVLSTITQAYNSHSTTQIALSMEQVRSGNNALTRDHALLREMLESASALFTERGERLQREIYEHTRVVRDSFHRLDIDNRGHTEAIQRMERRLDSIANGQLDPRRVAMGASPLGQGLRATLTLSSEAMLRCRPNCDCRCHTPKFINFWSSCFLGRLLGGYSSPPWCLSWLRSCTEQTCRRNTEPGRCQLHYIFPGWFLTYIARLNITSQFVFIPLYIRITTSATRQEPAAIFDAIKARNVSLTKRLLLNGDASIYDVSSYGWGLLHYASFYCWDTEGSDLSMIQTLLDAGVDGSLEDNMGYQPIETIVDDILMNRSMLGNPVRRFSSEALADVCIVFRMSSEVMAASYRDAKEHSHLHEVLLGINVTHHNLSCCAAEGEITRDTINLGDRRGRTPVTWAAEYGFADALKLFLDAGADPSQSGPSVCERSPLLTLAIANPAAQRGDEFALETIRLLVRAGADVNAKDGSGRAVVHMVAAKKSVDVLRILVEHAGARIDWRVLTPKSESVVDVARLVGASSEFVAAITEQWGKTREPLEDQFWDAVEHM